jgi:hypothetical protein
VEVVAVFMQKQISIGRVMCRASHETAESGERVTHIPANGGMGNEEFARTIFDEENSRGGLGRLRVDELFEDGDITDEIDGKGLEMFLGAS